jgi:hypothetical protein
MKFKNYIETESGIKDTSTSPGTAGQLLSSTVTGTSWIDQNTISSGSSEVVDIQVRNISSANGGVNLSKGDPVYIYGSVGASAKLYVDLADADSTATNNLGDSKMPCVALLDQDLAPNIEGTATVVGKLRNLITSPIDGATPSENDTVYVKSGGGLTLTKPTGSTNLIQNVGQVGRVSTSSDGNIVVAALLRSNDVPNLPTGRLFVGTAANTSLVSDVVYVDDALDRVGIGTTSPTALLTLESSSTSPYPGIDIKSTNTYPGGEIRFLNSSGSEVSTIESWSNPALSYLQLNHGYTTALSSTLTLDDGFLYLRTAGSERMRITNNGNTGIGTTVPSSKLHSVTTASGPVPYTQRAAILGVNNSTDTLYANSVGVAGQVRTSGGYAIYGDAYGAGGWAGYFDGKGYFSGNVGIGTTNPGQKLHVDGSIRVGDTNDVVYADKFFTVSNADLYIGTNNGYDTVFFNGPADERMRITSIGNVGIGTTNPGYKLDVNGGGKFKGDLIIGEIGTPGDLKLPTPGSNIDIGINTITGSDNSIALGSGNTVNAAYAVAAGQNNILTGNESFASGYGNVVSNIQSTSFGINNTSSGAQCLSMGNGTTASGGRALAGGFNTTASGSNAVAFGTNNTASGPQSFASGSNSTVAGFNSTSVGNNLSVTSSGCLATGVWNLDNGNYRFQVGAGTSDATRINAISVNSAGKILMHVLRNSASYSNDSAAAAGGVQLGELYRNGSIVQIRIT